MSFHFADEQTGSKKVMKFIRNGVTASVYASLYSGRSGSNSSFAS